MSEFDKYENGAYHWNATHDSSLLAGYSPSLEARYELPREILEKRHDLTNSDGIDIGCGDGAFLHSILEAGGEMIGVDASKQGLKLYEKRADNEKFPVFLGDATNLPVNETFDYATMIDVIEHLSEREKVLEEVRSVLAPGGTCIVTTPVAKGTEMESDYHVHEYTSEELKTVMERIFDSVDMYGYGPMRVFDLYENNTFGRQLVRVASRLGVNPFQRYDRDPDDQKYRYLLAVGKVT